MEYTVVGNQMKIADRECIGVETHSPTGAEIWLFLDSETGILVQAERIDGQWTNMDLVEAEAQYSNIISEVQQRIINTETRD